MVECSCISQSRALELNTSNRMWRLAWGRGAVVVEVEVVVVVEVEAAEAVTGGRRVGKQVYQLQG